MQTCSRCRSDNPDTAKFCYKCGGGPLRPYRRRYLRLSHSDLAALAYQCSRTRGTVGTVFVAVLLLLIGATLLFFGSTSSDQRHSSTPVKIVSNGGNQQATGTMAVVPPSPAQLCDVQGADLGQVQQGQSVSDQISFDNCGDQPMVWQVQNGDSSRLKLEKRSGDILAPKGKEQISFTMTASSSDKGQISIVVKILPAVGQPQQATVTMTVVVVERLVRSQQTQSLTAKATGQGKTEGTQAKGILQFRNPYSHTPRGVPVTCKAGTVFNSDANPNLQMMIDATITVPGDGTSVTVPAHVVQIGTIGNISEIQDWTHYSDSDLPLDISNSTLFTGGTDPQPYTFVQKDDIDKAVNPLKATTEESAAADLKRQLRPREHLSDLQCSSTVVRQNHLVGDHATNVTVEVQTTCTAKAST